MRSSRAAGALALMLVVACAPDFEDEGGSAGPAAPGDSATPGVTAATFPANGVVAEVPTIDNVFRIPELTVVAGTEVHWRNGGRNEHNIVPVDPADTSWGVALDDFAPGDEYSHVFSTPGTYAYYCTIHGTSERGMVGTVIVTEP